MKALAAALAEPAVHAGNFAAVWEEYLAELPEFGYSRNRRSAGIEASW